MKVYDLIFSNKRAPRISRHVIFWTTFYIYQVIRMSFLFQPNHVLSSASVILISSLVWGLVHNIFVTYTVAYYLVPKFFVKKKYVKFAVGILILLMIIFCYNFLFISVNRMLYMQLVPPKQQPYIFIRGTIIRLVGNAPLICGLFISLKTLKNWYQKQLENDRLHAGKNKCRAATSKSANSSSLFI